MARFKLKIHVETLYSDGVFTHNIRKYRSLFFSIFCNRKFLLKSSTAERKKSAPEASTTARLPQPHVNLKTSSTIHKKNKPQPPNPT